ncbi:MAG: aminoacetone oxidase family FAD-binding enzyme [Bacilli bacterium]|nr:aminoacetone oxidase family FAD-binding enzyme [Bacilli bacterium]
MKVAIIGGGISGVIASIYASENNEVTILERNNTLLKKLLLTGNGRCNYFNSNQNISNYNSSDLDLLKEIITEENIEKALNFYNNIGIIPKIKDGYYYPYSNKAESMKESLIKEVELNNIKVITNYLVENIEIRNNKFIINNELYFDKVIISTGSYAAPKTGSDGIGYKLLNKLNLDIIKPLPALVQLKGNETYFKEWNGIRSYAKVSLYENNKFIKEEVGELQLTNYGLSGICIFNLSGRLKIGLDKGNKESIRINFLPFVTDIEEFLINRNKLLKNRNIIELLESIINYKLIKIILKEANIKEDKSFDELNNLEKEKLFNNLINFNVDIRDTNDFDSSQVCSGGLDLNEINTKTMETKKIKNLYVIGELLDIDGLCGGYNITASTISAILAGENI